MYLLYASAHLFAIIGGASSMASSGILLDRSSYEPLGIISTHLSFFLYCYLSLRLDESQTAGFFSTHNIAGEDGKMNKSNNSLGAEEV
jgi:hypothetical protein